MNTLLLHLTGERAAEIFRGFRSEHLHVERRAWVVRKTMTMKAINTSAVCLYRGTTRKDGKEDILNLIPLLREKKPSCAIFVLDEEHDEERKKQTLDLGVDAYFSAPFPYRFIALKMKNIIYKKEFLNQKLGLRVFDLRLDLERRMARRNKYLIPLRNKEFSLLEFFMLNRGKLLTRNFILEQVWDRNVNFASNTVDVHINRLRRKIDDPFREKLIHTVHCLGYIFDRKKRLKLKRVDR